MPRALDGHAVPDRLRDACKRYAVIINAIVAIISTKTNNRTRQRPAIPVSEIPLIMCFWNARNASSTGTAARTAAPIIGPYSVL